MKESGESRQLTEGDQQAFHALYLKYQYRVYSTCLRMTKNVVEYPPGSVDPVHRHNAQAFVYVLEGSIVMQVKGGKEVTLTPGQTFYEGPEDIHVVGRNASKTKPAKFLVVLIKNKGAPVLVPVPQ
jgi:quercetin dioxygenase-like cupin family protein